ncbi:MAG: carbon storage regulator CsrA [Gammaproteobacteria bacterium]|nr:carbon storage regulator CsrA [Gammaproteobacteria bacterium]
MLILTRRIGEAIRIDEDIEVSVLGIRNNQVRLGFKAPDNKRVWREEIYQHRETEETNGKEHSSG